MALYNIEAIAQYSVFQLRVMLPALPELDSFTLTQSNQCSAWATEMLFLFPWLFNHFFISLPFPSLSSYISLSHVSLNLLCLLLFVVSQDTLFPKVLLFVFFFKLNN